MPYAAGRRFAKVNIIAAIVSIRARKMMRYIGMMEKPSLPPKSPKSGGMKVEPTYALAIWMPMMALEFSAPKVPGVAWMMQG